MIIFISISTVQKGTCTSFISEVRSTKTKITKINFISESLYDEEEDLDEETGLDDSDNFLEQGKLGLEANNNSLSEGLSPATALDKTPPLADSSTERDMMNDSEGQ